MYNTENYKELLVRCNLLVRYFLLIRFNQKFLIISILAEITNGNFQMIR